MLMINKNDAERLAVMVEYLVKHEATATVEEIMRELGITFEEYRTLCILIMPTLRYKNMFSGQKCQTGYYKGVYLKEKAERENLEQITRTMYDYLDKVYGDNAKEKKEDKQNGDSDDSGNDNAEPDNPDRG